MRFLRIFFLWEHFVSWGTIGRFVIKTILFSMQFFRVEYFIFEDIISLTIFSIDFFFGDNWKICNKDDSSRFIECKILRILFLKTIERFIIKRILFSIECNSLELDISFLKTIGTFYNISLTIFSIQCNPWELDTSLFVDKERFTIKTILNIFFYRVQFFA